MAGFRRNASKKSPGAAEMIKNDNIETPKRTGIERINLLRIYFNKRIRPPRLRMKGDSYESPLLA
jgi:hypothetical protein